MGVGGSRKALITPRGNWVLPPAERRELQHTQHWLCQLGHWVHICLIHRYFMCRKEAGLRPECIQPRVESSFFLRQGLRISNKTAHFVSSNGVLTLCPRDLHFYPINCTNKPNPVRCSSGSHFSFLITLHI